jgi:hypothetical protein
MPLVIACPSVELLHGMPKRAMLSHQQDACQLRNARKTALSKIRIAAKLLLRQQHINTFCWCSRKNVRAMTAA